MSWYESSEVQDGPEHPLPIVVEIEGPGRDYDGGYISTRKPQLPASQKKLDKLFSASPFEQATNSRSKCAFCSFAKCQLPLGRGCYRESVSLPLISPSDSKAYQIISQQREALLSILCGP